MCFWSGSDIYLMKLWVDNSLDHSSVESFLNESFDKINNFCQVHLRLIEDCGAFIRKDSYVLCFCAPRHKEPELFVVRAQDKINNKETFDSILNSSIPFPMEYEWEELK